NPANATNCAGVLPNPALTVTPDSTGIIGTVVIDWYDGANGGNQVGSATNSFVAADVIPGSYTYYAEARVGGTACRRLHCTPVTLMLNAVPLAPTNALNATNCAGVLPNPELSVTPDSGGVNGGTVVIDWYANASGGSALSNGTSSFVPGDILPGPHTYYAEA